MQAPLFHFNTFNEDMHLIHKVDIPLSNPRMIHDFSITERHVIIPDLPAEFDIEKAINEDEFPFAFNK